jgi:hypothetical protein
MDRRGALGDTEHRARCSTAVGANLMLRGEIEKVGALTGRQLEASLLAILVVVLVKVSLLALDRAQS